MPERLRVGGIQGYFGRRIDLFGQRFVEIWAGIPTLFILIILASMVESNVFRLLGILVAFGWMSLVGVVRAEFLRARNLHLDAEVAKSAKLLRLSASPLSMEGLT